MEVDYPNITPSVFIEVCRACMKKDIDLKPLFIDFKDSRTSLPEILQQVTGLNMTENDGLPSHICTRCITLAETALNFKQLCYQSDVNFRKVLSGESIQLKPFIKQEYNTFINLELNSLNFTKINDRDEEQTANEKSDDVENKDDKNSTEPYKCGYCCDSFRVCDKLKEHVKNLHGDKLDNKLKYSCTVCLKNFRSKKGHVAHNKKCVLKNEKKIKVKQEVVSDDSDSDTPLSEKVNNLHGSVNTPLSVKSDIADNSTADNSEYYNDDGSSTYFDIDMEDSTFVYDNVKTETVPLEEKKFSCDECNLTLTKEMYDAHRKAVHTAEKKKKPSKKKTKGKMDDVNGDISDDKLLDSENVPKVKIQCIYCERKFLKEASLKAHIKKHEKKFDEVHKCDICNREFKRRAHLENHMLTHSIDKGIKCNQCPRAFSRQESLNIHVANSHQKGAKKHKCPHCEKSFSMLSTLKDHIRTHTGEKPFLCSICGRGFSQSTNLKEHMRRHQGYKPFKCNFCSQTFVSKGELEAHFRKHSGAHPFVCDECGGGFTTSSSLVKHKRIHSGERPYKCDFCPMKFTALGTMKNHRRTHTGEKPYKCQYCDKAFVQKNDLVTHTRTHTGERPYVCTVCGHAFRQSSALKTHLKIHGGQIDQLPVNVGPIRHPEQIDSNMINRPVTEESSSSLNMMTPKSENSNL